MVIHCRKNMNVVYVCDIIHFLKVLKLETLGLMPATILEPQNVS